MGNSSHLIAILSVSLLYLFASNSHSLPLSTSGRWIIDASTGERVKLRCANWAAHLQVMLAEGLDKQPIREIVSEIANQGLNCVRLTWATYMFTRYANQTISETLDGYGLNKTKLGITKNNPLVLNLTHLEAYDAVVNEVGVQRLMVVSDNHVREPKWCCGPADGISFVGNSSFESREWLQGLSLAAQYLKSKHQVVAMSLRNELCDPLRNLSVWYEYITHGAQTVRQANPNILVIISGLDYDTSFNFLKTNPPPNISFANKVVYEVHSYTFWSKKKSCDETMQELNDKGGFLIGGPNPAPLFVSEFGIDLQAKLEHDERWLTCIASYLAGEDLDWAWWALQGSYYVRAGGVNTDEPYGLLNFNWNQPSYPQFRQRFQLLLKKIQDPSSKLSKSYIMFHPQSGHCIQATRDNELEVSDCGNKSRWRKEGSRIKLVDTAACLKAVGEGLPARLSNDCWSQQSAWKSLSRSGLHLATWDGNGQKLCLQIDTESSRVLTKRCICVEGDPGCLDYPQEQWFQLVPTNVD